MSTYILSHDLGTSGNKASLFSEDGTLIGSRVESYGVHYFNGTWAEQDAMDWWNAVCVSTKKLIEETKTDPADIKAVSFSGQMMCCLCVDRDGNPLRPAIIWADQRAVKQQAQLAEKISAMDYYRIVGMPNAASYAGQKLMWVRDNEPEIYEATYKMLNPKDFIVQHLTGKFYTDYSDANGSTCFDQNKLEWSDELFCRTGLDPDKFPEIKPSTFVAGGVTAQAAALTGLKEGTPVVIGAGDGVAANVGAGSIKPGQAYGCMGTSAWIATTSDHPVLDPQMRIVCWAHAVPGLYSPNGTMQSAGGSYSWLKNTICQREQLEAKEKGVSVYDLINEEIEASPAGANGVMFLPYLLGERAPRWDVNAKGAFLGLKAENTRNDMLRSVLEGVSMNLALIFDILNASGDIHEVLLVGGGAKGRVWRQIMADLLNTRITVPAILEEANSMGAAVIGGVGAGIYDSFEAIDRFVKITDVQEPDPAAVAAYAPVRALFEECYQALKPVFAKM